MNDTTTNDRITDFLKDGKRTYYLDENNNRIYVEIFEEGDTRVDPRSGKTEKFSGEGWVKYDVDAELSMSLSSQGENRR